MDGPLTFQLLQTLLHNLSHQLRTPLSVITNELFYLESEGHREECGRALARSRQIGEILSIAGRLGKTGLEMAVSNPSLMIGRSLKVDVPETALLPFPLDEQRLDLALCELLSLLDRYFPGCLTRVEAGAVVFSLADRACPQFEASAWTPLFEELRADSLWPPCIDAILDAHGIRTQIRLGRGQGTMRLVLPLQMA